MRIHTNRRLIKRFAGWHDVKVFALSSWNLLELCVLVLDRSSGWEWSPLISVLSSSVFTFYSEKMEHGSLANKSRVRRIAITKFLVFTIDSFDATTWGGAFMSNSADLRSVEDSLQLLLQMPDRLAIVKMLWAPLQSFVRRGLIMCCPMLHSVVGQKSRDHTLSSEIRSLSIAGTWSWWFASQTNGAGPGAGDIELGFFISNANFCLLQSFLGCWSGCAVFMTVLHRIGWALMTSAWTFLLVWPSCLFARQLMTKKTTGTLRIWDPVHLWG